MPLRHPPYVMLRTPLHAFRNATTIPLALDPAFEEGLYLSAPDFWKELNKIQQPLKEKLSRTLSKYWIRSCMRSTPYATFAGNTLVPVSDAPTCLTLNTANNHRICRRLDMACLAEIIASLGRMPQIKSQLKYYPNNSLYRLQERYRYTSYSLEHFHKDYQLTELRSSPYLSAILDASSGGAFPGELVMLICASEEVSTDEALSFINELIEAQVLVSELEPCLTGDDPIDTLIAQLAPLHDAEDPLSALHHIRQLLRGPGSGAAHVRSIESVVRNLDPTASWPPQIVQSDMFLSVSGSTINTSLLAEIAQQAEDLLVLSRPAHNPELDLFQGRFYDLYEDAELPLSLALDADLGIGYGGIHDEAAGGSPIIDGLIAGPDGARSAAKPATRMDGLVATAFSRYLDENAGEIIITSEDLARFKSSAANQTLPRSMSLIGSLLKTGPDADAGAYLFYVSGIGGPSAGNLLGRFTYGDKELLGLTRSLLAAEEAADPDAIYAEVVHLPQARAGNILARPLLRDYEIPYIGKSGAAIDKQIPIDDLMLSIRDGALYLRSRKLNGRVIPRLSTAHNFSLDALPVYRFLCDLQQQGMMQPLVWDWGALSAWKRLPRVRYKNLILQRARWIIQESDLAGLPEDNSEQQTYFLGWRELHKLPARVVFTKADHELLIDFRTDNGIGLFLYYLRRYKTILLQEFLFSEENAAVHDANGEAFTNELIIPLTADSVAARQTSMRQKAVTSIPRKFAPGSEWQYFKVYCGSKTAEEILINALLPLVRHGIEARLFERFFFIRYRDEWSHLRIRFLNQDISKQASLQNAFMKIMQPLMDGGVIHRLSIDTYNREIERYGPDLIEASEALFHNDSLAVLQTLELLEGSDESYRLLFALRSINTLLDDFGLDTERKQALLKSLADDYFREFGGNAALRKGLNERYRQQQVALISHLNAIDDVNNSMEEAVGILQDRSLNNLPFISAIKQMIQADGAERISTLLSDYIHMHMNRMFIGQQRKWELVVYHFLEKYYASRLVIERRLAETQPYATGIPILQP